MATLFAIGSFIFAIIFGAIWYPMWWFFEPGWAIFWGVAWYLNGTFPLAAQSGEDVLWMLGPPVMLFSLAVSAGIWAAIGFHLGKYLGKKK